MFAESKYWYSRHLRGKHNLNDMMKMCSEAGIEGHFTNHSLRATETTQLFERNIHEFTDVDLRKDFVNTRSHKKAEVSCLQHSHCTVNIRVLNQEVVQAGIVQNSPMPFSISIPDAYIQPRDQQPWKCPLQQHLPIWTKFCWEHEW